MATNDVRILRAALLWLRNHYEVGDRNLSDKVIERIDAVLKWQHPTSADMDLFRKLYPGEVVS